MSNALRICLIVSLSVVWGQIVDATVRTRGANFLAAPQAEWMLAALVALTLAAIAPWKTKP